ncbi:MAG: SGNH/GDSL hydrolase family protein [Planctomycetota bacterium]
MAAAALLIIAVSVDNASGQTAKRTKRSPHPSFAAPVVDDTLPNVLLIGDSISMGYTIAVRNELVGEANVFRPLTNCGPTTRGLEGIEEWIANRDWDVIHFNFGLHDLKYMGADGSNLADPQDPTASQQVPIQQYADNLRVIAQRLIQTGAIVIWRQTTPVPDGAKGRVAGDAVKYNQAAADVMAEFPSIQTDPFHSFALKIADLQLKANVHYTPEGSSRLGKHVAELISEALSQPAS